MIDMSDLEKDYNLRVAQAKGELEAFLKKLQETYRVQVQLVIIEVELEEKGTYGDVAFWEVA